MTENDKLGDFDLVKHNAMPDIAIGGPPGEVMKTYDAMMKSIAASITIPVGIDAASMVTKSMLGPATSTAMQAIVGQYSDTASKLASAIAPVLTANLAGPQSIIAAAMTKNFEGPQAIIAASLARNFEGPQSAIAAAITKDFEGPQSIIAASLAKNFEGPQSVIAAAMASGLAPKGSVASMLSNIDSVVKSVESSQRQISKNAALIDAMESPVNQPLLVSPTPFNVKKFRLAVDPTPALMRKNLEVMREMLDANKTLLSRDVQREAAKVVADKRARRKDTIILWLTVALVVIGAITIFEVLPR